MKHINKKYFKKKVVDSKDWKKEHYDRDQEDSYLKRQKRARDKIPDAMARWAERKEKEEKLKDAEARWERFIKDVGNDL